MSNQSYIGNRPADSALTAEQVEDGIITEEKIAAGAVTHAKRTYNSGEVIQSAYAEVTALSSTGATFPDDDTIPQSGEGAELMTVSITPKFANSKLRVRFSAPIVSLTTVATMVFALFRDATANAVQAAAHVSSTANYRYTTSLEVEVAAGAVDATTFKLRYGTNGAGTLYVNGASAARFYGGAVRATLVVEEIAA